ARLDRVSSVSGGSFVAGRLAVAWARLQAERFTRAAVEEHVVKPLIHQSHRFIDVPAGLFGLLPFLEPATIVAWRSAHTFEHKRLKDLPLKPRFIFNTTNLMTGVLFRFESGGKGI